MSDRRQLPTAPESIRRLLLAQQRRLDTEKLELRRAMRQCQQRIDEIARQEREIAASLRHLDH